MTEYDKAKSIVDITERVLHAAATLYDVHFPLIDYIDVIAWAKARDAFMKPYLSIYHDACLACIPLTPEESITYTESDPSIGDIMSIDEFTSHCTHGGFIDSDGYGYLVYKGKETDIGVWPSLVLKGLDMSRFNGVSWYNK